jgi:hypothetical protein
MNQILEQLTRYKGLSSSDNFLNSLVEASPNPCHIKDANSGEYIFSNTLNAEIYGLSNGAQLIGKTVNEIHSLMSSIWDRTYPSDVSELDLKAITKDRYVQDNHRVLLTYNYYLRIQDMIKIPVHGRHGTTVAILTYSICQNHHFSIEQIYHIHLKNLDKNQSIISMLRYMKVMDYFLSLPTHKELILFITMRKTSNYKLLARKLDLSVKTIETHICNLRHKIKYNDLHGALAASIR